jgi:hypothetical protein
MINYNEYDVEFIHNNLSKLNLNINELLISYKNINQILI